MDLALLAPAAFLAAALSGAIGMGGGVTLLAVMAAILPPDLVVPIHGVVQLTSNSTRAARLIGRVCWPIAALYLPAMTAGVFLGLRFYQGAGLPWFRPAIGAFVFSFLIWDRFRPRRLILPRSVFVPAGLIGGLLTILIGASGPFLAAFFLRDDLDREPIVATKAVIQTAGHLLKIPAFLWVGFAYGDHLGTIVTLIACAVAGTLVGTWALRRMGERVFRVAFRVILALLAAKLLLGRWI